MGHATFFVEGRARAHLHSDGGERLEVERGFSLERAVDARVELSWAEVRGAEELGRLPEEMCGPAEAAWSVPSFEMDRLAAVRALLDGARAGSPGLSWRYVERHRRTGWGPERTGGEVQDIAQLELSFRLEAGGTVSWEQSFEDAGAFTRAALVGLGGWVEELAARRAARSEAVACPSGTLPIVLPPGSDAGVFFHELCGHPLEGDVVLRGGSFLAAGLGEARRVAAECLSVSDDPTRRSGGVHYRFDDEGSAAREALLLDGGRVREALLDRASARGLRRDSNGHGRRISFRHPALPRMSHTRVLPGEGTLASLVAGVEEGLLVSYLTPRHVHLLSGGFSFFFPEAREIRGGRLGAYVRPGILRGRALEALASVEAVGADSATFYGLKGCGKLDQGDLPVSFELPTVRLGPLSVEPAP